MVTPRPKTRLGAAQYLQEQQQQQQQQQQQPQTQISLDDKDTRAALLLLIRLPKSQHKYFFHQQPGPETIPEDGNSKTGLTWVIQPILFKKIFFYKSRVIFNLLFEI